MARTPSTMVALSTPAPDFALPDTTGRTVRRADFAGKPLLVMFLCNHCPYVKHVADPLARLVKGWQARGLAVVGINSNDAEAYPEDSPQAMVAEAKSRGYSFPYLFDASQRVARAYDAACTPDFFLFDAQHRLAYRGQLDASRPGSPIPVTGADLGAAVDAVLAGKTPKVEQVPSLGCNIKWRSA